MKIIIIFILIVILAIIGILFMRKKEEKFISFVPSEEIINLGLLNTPRPNWVDKRYNTVKLIDNVEFDWANGIYGMMYVDYPRLNKSFYAFSSMDRDKLILAPIARNGNIVDQNIEELPMLNICSNISGSRYGQGSELIGYGAHGYDDHFLVPIICGNNTIINVRSRNRLGASTYYTLQNKQVNWIATDPITGYIFVPESYRNLRKIDIYKFDYSRPFDIKMTYVTNCILTTPIVECTAGCFSKNGILYLLDNNRDTSGFKAYSFSYNRRLNRYELVLKKSYRITKPRDESVSIFGLEVSDAQDLVGITVDKNDNIFTLLRNTNVVTDGITLWKTSGLM